MMSADKRMEELLDRWSASLERHARYLALDDAAYAKVEAWPPHARPTRWVVDLARQRLLELRAELTKRRESSDPGFAEALELMSFLSGLLGSEHLERFIPLATGKTPDTTAATGTVEQPRPPRPAKPRSKAAPPVAAPAHAAAAPKAGKAPAPREAPARPAPSTRPAAAPEVPAAPASDPLTAQVIADAVRMLEWGREWPAIAGLIARMADRPPEADVWKILRAHRSEILARARRPAD